jgi:hypothetical protein
MPPSSPRDLWPPGRLLLDAYALEALCDDLHLAEAYPLGSVQLEDGAGDVAPESDAGARAMARPGCARSALPVPPEASARRASNTNGPARRVQRSELDFVASIVGRESQCPPES